MSFDAGDSTADLGKTSMQFLFSSPNSRLSGFFKGLGERGEEFVVYLNLNRFLVFELREIDFEFYFLLIIYMGNIWK